MDSTFIRNKFDEFKCESDEQLIGHWLNLVDLFHSKSNFDGPSIEKRLKTIQNVLKRLSNEIIILEDPYYWMLEEIHPDQIIKGACLMNRKEQLLAHLSQIILDPSKTDPKFIEYLKTEAQVYYNVKLRKIKEAVKLAKKVKKILKDEHGIDNPEPHHFYPACKDLLYGNLLLFSQNESVILNCPHIEMKDINFDKYELFLKSYSVFLWDISCDGKTPELNDNVDVTQLLYINSPDKILIMDGNWISRIERSGLEHYLKNVN